MRPRYILVLLAFVAVFALIAGKALGGDGDLLTDVSKLNLALTKTEVVQRIEGFNTWLSVDAGQQLVVVTLEGLSPCDCRLVVRPDEFHVTWTTPNDPIPVAFQPASAVDNGLGWAFQPQDGVVTATRMLHYGGYVALKLAFVLPEGVTDFTVLYPAAAQGAAVAAFAPTPVPTLAVIEVVTEAATEEVVLPTIEPTLPPTWTPIYLPPPTLVPTEVAVVADTVADANTVVVAPDGQVILGFAASLSGEGIAPLGIDIQRGAELALMDRPMVTRDGQSFAVRLDVQDDLCSADGGQAVANRFAANVDIAGVVGPMCSSACRAAAPIFDAAGLTNISPSCSAPDLSNSGFTSFNRAVVSDAYQGKIAAAFIYNQLGLRRIATLHDGSYYGEGLIRVVTDTFTALGGEVVAADSVTVGDTDFRGLLEDIAAEEPELIYFGGFPAEAARLIQQRADTGLEDVIFFGADGISGAEVIDLSGVSAEGVYATKGIPPESPVLDAFLTKYEQTYGEEPPAPYHTTAYDAVNVLLDAIEHVSRVDSLGNLSIDRAEIARYVRSLKSFDGLYGTLNADGTGELATADIGIFRVVNGEFVQVAAEMIDQAESSAAEEKAATVFAPGLAVRVLSPAGLILRSSPSVKSSIIVLLPVDEMVLILDGPVLADGITWYHVWRSDGTEGWTASEVNGLPTLQ